MGEDWKVEFIDGFDRDFFRAGFWRGSGVKWKDGLSGLKREGKARANGDEGVELCFGGPGGGRLGRVEGGGITVSDEASLRVRGLVGGRVEVGGTASKESEPAREEEGEDFLKEGDFAL